MRRPKCANPQCHGRLFRGREQSGKGGRELESNWINRGCGPLELKIRYFGERLFGQGRAAAWAKAEKYVEIQFIDLRSPAGRKRVSSKAGQSLTRLHLQPKGYQNL